MPPQNLRAVGDRIEQLLDDLHAIADPRARATAEELLRSVTELYGGGLERIMQLASADVPAFGQLLVDDELVGSLLIVHGLHPDTIETRVERALETVRPFLAQHDGNVELIDIDARAGAVYLRLLGSCDGCPSSTVTLQLAVEAAIIEAAPEIVTIDVDQPTPAPAGVPVTLGRKPDAPPAPATYEHCPVEVANA
jgi:Fe-S cluster biogenesis protein NfuA